LTADSTDDQTLQKGVSFPGWALAAFKAMGLGVLAQAVLVFLEFFPRDVALVDIRNESMPGGD
jgi:hypothetical protein